MSRQSLPDDQAHLIHRFILARWHQRRYGHVNLTPMVTLYREEAEGLFARMSKRARVEAIARLNAREVEWDREELARPVVKAVSLSLKPVNA